VPGARDEAIRVAGIARIEAGRRAALSADQHRHLERQPAVELAQRVEQRLAYRSAA
jgi:hypothetical protein